MLLIVWLSIFRPRFAWIVCAFVVRVVVVEYWIVGFLFDSRLLFGYVNQLYYLLI